MIAMAIITTPRNESGKVPFFDFEITCPILPLLSEELIKNQLVSLLLFTIYSRKTC